MRVLIVLWAALFLANGAAAETGTLDASVIFDLEYADDPQVSPDGKAIVYTRFSSDRASDQRFANLWLVRNDRSEHIQLSDGLHFDFRPRWSPDGQSIAFFSNRTGTKQLHMLDVASGAVRQLTNTDQRLHSFVWAPDSARFALLMDTHAPPLVIGGRLEAREGETRARPIEYYERLGWRFSYAGEESPGKSEVFVLTASEGSLRQLTDDEREWGRYGHGAQSYWLSWTDPETILTVSRSAHDEEFRLKNSDIFEVSVADGILTQITDRVGPDNKPVASPDGRYIAYTGYQERGTSVHISELHIYDRETGESRSITPNLDRDVSSPVWRSDSKAIIARFDDRAIYRVGEFTLDGKVHEVARDLGTSGYAMGQGGFSYAGGVLATAQSTPDVVGDIYAAPLGEAQRRLTDLNADALEGIALGRMEDITWAPSADDLEIHGYLIYPVDFDPAKTYPLVLQIHGGPHLHHGPRFDIEGRIMAARGYLVISPNYRGSTSYGLDFALGIDETFPAINDYTDLMSSVDAVRAKGIVDDARLYVTGGSAGGLYTQWITTRTNRFKAAVSHYPVTNWTSLATGGDISSYVMSNWFGGSLWDVPEDYLRRSPLFYADQVKTPTMIMTGDQDWRTPFGEAEQWFGALRLNGVDTVLARVPGAPHSYEETWAPSHAAERISAQIAWFERYGGRGRGAKDAEDAR